ncbi:MAG: hypothetical protein DRN21_06465 [Thermoplasmata archaeon]|nr:MAG: hypothetical protein DRN21_06465 [Thermoplasmata archaeon]
MLGRHIITKVKERNEGERDDMPGFNSTNSQIHQKMQRCRVKDAINPVDTFIGGGAASFLFQQI